MKTVETTVANYSGSFPSTLAINATGAGATDGTEYTAEYINNFIFGISQAWLDYASVTPNGVTESAANSQFIDATKKGFNVGPGIRVMYDFNSDPATLGYRFLPLNGQGVLFASYPDLDAICYVGDGNNAAVAAAGGAYYRASDAAGTTPNIAGPYLILPETRGYAPRGLDTAATVDPDGAARYLGDNQADAMQRIQGTVGSTVTVLDVGTGVFTAGVAIAGIRGANGASSQQPSIFDSSTSTTPNAAKTNDVETRMANVSTNFGVGY